MLLPHNGLVFDCDGLLVNTQGAWDRAYQQMFDYYGVPLDRTTRRQLVGLQRHALGARLAAIFNRPAAGHTLALQIYEMVQTNLGQTVTAMPGAVDLIHAAARTTPIAVASNTPHMVVCDYLHHVGLDAIVEVIVGSDDVPNPKPAPDTYLAACAHLHLPPDQAIAFEDSPTGVQAARAAGLHVIGVPSSPGLDLEAHQVVPTLNDPWLWRALALPDQPCYPP